MAWTSLRRILPRVWRSIDGDWTAELLDVEELFMKLYNRLPKEMEMIRPHDQRAMAFAEAVGDADPT